MSNRTIVTNYFRASFPHLDKAHKQEGSQGEPKFSIGALFPKSGVLPAHLGGHNASNDTILAALNEVCMEEWGIPYKGDGLTFTQGHTMASFPADQGWTEDMIIQQGYAIKAADAAEQLGVQFPPPCVDGDTDWMTEKNAAGVEVKKIGTPKEQSKGMWKMSFKNGEKVAVGSAGSATSDPVDIEPSAVYAGCWCRAKIQVSAYKGGQGNVIAIKLLSVQKCYDDESFGGREAPQTAAQAFAGMGVADTNIQAGDGQSMGAVPPVPQAGQAGVVPPPVAPAQAVAPVAPAQAVAPVAPAQAVAPVAPAQAVAPVAPAQAVAPVAPAQAVAPVAPAQAVAPVAPAQAPTYLDPPPPVAQ